MCAFGRPTTPVDPPVTTVNVTGITVSNASVTIEKNENVQLSWTVLPSDATNKNVTFGLSNSGIASVNATGLVTGLAAGNVIITITTVDGGFTATVNITVVERESPPEPPVDPDTPTTPTQGKKCGGSIVVTSAVLSAMSLLGICLLSFKKRKI